MAAEITDANFDELVRNAGNKPVMIDFWAVWCGPCRLIAPIVEELSSEYADIALVGKMDVDNNPDIPVEFGIRNIPTILFFKNGEVVDRQVGSVPKNVLVQKLNALL